MHGRWCRKESHVSRIDYASEREDTAKQENSPVEYFLQAHLEDIPFTKAIKNVLVREAPQLLSSLLAVFPVQARADSRKCYNKMQLLDGKGDDRIWK